MAADTLHRAFSDRRAFIIPTSGIGPTDPHRSEVLTTQAEDGPTYIQVGVSCTDAYLYAVWQARKRFPGVTLEQLRAARDNRVQQSEVQHD